MINRKIKPEAKEELFFTLPEIKKKTLTNGLQVVYIQKNKLPFTRLNLLIDCGSRYDPENGKGLSNLVSMIIDEGADGMSALEISDAFDMLGSNFSVSSDNETINFKLQTLTENLDTSLNIFSKVLLKPDFKQQDFEREKRKILTRLVQLSDEPEFIAQRIMEFLTFGKNNPYAFPSLGYVDDIENIKLENVTKFYSGKFSPSSAHLVAVGSNDFESFIGIVESYFLEWSSLPDKSELSYNSHSEEKKIYLYDKKDSVQSEIRVSHLSVKRNDYTFFPRMILNTVLGGQFTSRINLNLREDKGYTYGAFSGFNYFKEAAYFYVSTSVGMENTNDAVNEIYNELDKIRNGITASELEFAKSSIIKKFPANFETYRQITANLVTKVIHSLPDDFFNNYINNVKKVTAEQVKKAAEDLILPQKAFCVVVGDRDKLINSLRTTEIEIVEVDDRGIKI
jgi:zinc protease